MSATPATWQHFTSLFAERANRPLPTLDADLDYTQLPRSLAHSLAVFQLGESGGGTVISQARTSTLRGIDEHYADAMSLFVREENRHASILAVCVRLLGGELIRENWTAKLFVFGRRLIGLRLKVMVLLAAEVVGLCYYQLLASRLPACDMRRWLMAMVADEADHLDFHCAFLRRQITGPASRAVFIATWRALMFASELVVLIDHRKALRDMQIDRSEVRALWAKYRRLAERSIVNDARPSSHVAMERPS